MSVVVQDFENALLILAEMDALLPPFPIAHIFSHVLLLARFVGVQPTKTSHMV